MARAWEEEMESQPENPSSHGLHLSPPVASKRLLFSSCFGLFGQIIKEQLENAFLKAVIK